jgi:hypothetical protein
MAMCNAILPNQDLDRMRNILPSSLGCFEGTVP